MIIRIKVSKETADRVREEKRTLRQQEDDAIYDHRAFSGETCSFGDDNGYVATRPSERRPEPVDEDDRGTSRVTPSDGVKPTKSRSPWYDKLGLGKRMKKKTNHS